MKARFLTALVIGSAFVACKDDTAVYPGGTPGAGVTMALSRSAFTLRQADTGSIAAQILDSAGNLASGAPTIASCNASVVAVASGTAPNGWSGLATVTATGIGQTCITVTSGSLVDTALVDVGPYALTITGPAAGTAGQTYVYHVTATDPAGAAASSQTFVRTWSGSSANFAPVSKSGTADSVSVKSNGTKGTFRVQVASPNGATGFLSVVIN